VDVYLFPAPVGGGLGDIEEVLAVGRKLSADRHSIFFFASPERPLPRGLDGPLRWPSHQRVSRPSRSSEWAVVVTPSWGVCAAPERPGPLGRPGTWADEVGAVESAYGTDRTLLLSIEEFARTLTSREQVAERYREGGVPVREIRRRFRDGRLSTEVETFHRDYARYRGFSVPNIAHLYASFAPSSRFRHEFPEAIQIGPIVFPRSRHRGRPHRRNRVRSWAVYTGPSASAELISAVRSAVAETAPGTGLVLASSPAKPQIRPLGLNSEARTAGGGDSWPELFRHADARIVTGSRSLLEALSVGGPFLYFNGTTGREQGRRRHRPEKLQRLLDVWRSTGVSARLRWDLSDFARGRNVRAIVQRAAADERWRRSFPTGIPTRGFPNGFEQGEAVVSRIVRALPELGSVELVAQLRSGRLPKRPRARRASPRTGVD
ncbi:MAG TPA: hypothetical protein VJQ43_06580, partial [Thermoplasmata archaeon]|nr:hypothetical protein [Thermoplasmata archaeon]